VNEALHSGCCHLSSVDLNVQLASPHGMRTIPTTLFKRPSGECTIELAYISIDPSSCGWRGD